MTDPDRAEERRELERRAFGRDGAGLSPAESARLAELRREDAPAPLAGALPPDSDPLGGAPQGAPDMAGGGVSGSWGVSADGGRDPGSWGAAAEADRIPGSWGAAADGGRVPGTWGVAADGGRVPGSLSEDAGGDRDETRSPSGTAPSGSSPDASGAVPPSAPVGESGPSDGFAAPLRARVRAWIAGGRWKRPRYVVGGLLVLLAAGVALGAAIPRPPDAGLALRAGEGERRDRIVEHDDFDPGSVLLLARSDTALLWYATQSRGELLCAIVDAKRVPPQRSCVPKAAIREQPLAVSAQSRPRADGVVDGDHGVVALTGTGMPVGFLQHWSSTVGPDPALRPEEVAAWERIVREHGFQNLMVVGRIGAIPVWLGYQSPSDGVCLVVEDVGTAQTVCGETRSGEITPSAADGDPPSLTLDLPATEQHVAYRLEYWTGFSSYLMVTAEPDPQPTSLLGPMPSPLGASSQDRSP